MCMMEELMPMIGSSVPSPSLLAVTLSLTESVLQNFGKHCSNVLNTVPVVDINNHFDINDKSLVICNTHLLSISDDGKIWDWLLTAEGETPKEKTNPNIISEANDEVTSAPDPNLDSIFKQPEDARRSTSRLSNPCITQDKLLFKVGANRVVSTNNITVFVVGKLIYYFYAFNLTYGG